MQHLGDITAIDGAKIPPVDVITGGSPCQDLSIAGKRAGLAGARSGLFMEQIRIIKEMRKHDRTTGRSGEFLRPRYMVWENVPGAFSSNKGKDFAAVLEETIRIVEPEAPSIEVPEKGWPAWGCYRSMDGRWSVAWRTLDAQYWGVPQRRRRIALVADFGGNTAAEILFERKGMSGDFTEGESTWENVTSGTGKSASDTVWCLQGNGIDRANTAGCNGRGWKENVSYTLNTGDRHCISVFPAKEKPKFALFENHSQDCRYKGPLEVCPTLPAQLGTGGNNQPFVVQAYSFDALASNSMKSKNPNSGCRAVDVAKTLDTSYPDPSKNQGGIAIVQTYQDTTGTLSPGAHAGSYNGQDAYNDMLIAHPILSKSNCSFRADMDTFPISDGFVRRLTPLECERLQGYPDGWTDIDDWTDSKEKVRKTSDSARYKALWNSIALPPWRFVLSRIYGYLRTGATLGSLFDGIGGFPLIWTQLGGKAVWASEIEEFCIAVTKRRFGHG